jgi:glycosyltransferase involved in cell wall biosynthesis
MVSVVVPAHNESVVIGRLLRRLADPADSAQAAARLEIVVVCNGCSDDTAGVAASFPGVHVLSTDQPGKANAMRLGDAAASSFPRVYVDADVELGAADVLALCRALDEPGILVAAPNRHIPTSEASLLVRLYYAVWQELPGVQTGVFGRGVIAVSRAAFERIALLPPVMADDLAVSAAFAVGERRIVESAVVVVHPPRTWADLIRRRVRATTGSHQVYETGDMQTVSDSRTSPRDLLTVLRKRPSAAAGIPVFIAAAMIARRRAAAAMRDGDYSTWLRDESSRTGS